MAEAQSSTPVVGYPTREIRITGERVALMFHTCIRVSRFEQSLVSMVMAGNNTTRASVKAAAERFNRALTHFEEELKEAERELNNASRPSNRSRTNQDSKPQSGASKQSQAAKPQPAKPAISAQPAAQATPKAADVVAASPKPSNGQAGEKPAKQSQAVAATQAPAPKAQTPSPQPQKPKDKQRNPNNNPSGNGGNAGNNGNQKAQPKGDRNNGQAATPNAGNGKPVENSNQAPVVPVAETQAL